MHTNKHFILKMMASGALPSEKKQKLGLLLLLKRQSKQNSSIEE